jgi:hypothetical protein
MQKLFEDVKAVVDIEPQATDTTLNGTAIDITGYEDAMAIISVGAASGTPTGYTVDAKIQESADGSTGWADITGAAITQIVDTDDVTAEVKVDLRRAARKGYIRVVLTAALTGGSSPAIPVCATFVLGTPTYAPVGNSVTAD